MQKHMCFLTSKLAEPPRAIYPKIRLGGSASSNPLGDPLENHFKKSRMNPAAQTYGKTALKPSTGSTAFLEAAQVDHMDAGLAAGRGVSGTR